VRSVARLPNFAYRGLSGWRPRAPLRFDVRLPAWKPASRMIPARCIRVRAVAACHGPCLDLFATRCFGIRAGAHGAGNRLAPLTSPAQVAFYELCELSLGALSARRGRASLPTHDRDALDVSQWELRSCGIHAISSVLVVSVLPGRRASMGQAACWSVVSDPPPRQTSHEANTAGRPTSSSTLSPRKEREDERDPCHAALTALEW